MMTRPGGGCDTTCDTSVGSVLCGTILNYVISIGHHRGQPIQRPMMKMAHGHVYVMTSP